MVCERMVLTGRMPQRMELSSLVSWLGTFEDIHVSTASPVLLCDGVVLQKVMMQMYDGTILVAALTGAP